MKKALIFSFAVLCIVSAMAIPCISAVATYVPGVKAGQVITYSFTDTPASPVNVTIHVKSVSGSNVTYTKNNISTNIVYDVSHVISHSPWYFVAANLSLSDAMYVGSVLWFVTATNPAYNIAGDTWNAIRCQGSGSGVTIDGWWEKTTGILLYWQYDGVSIHQNYSILSIGTESIPMDPSFIVASLAVGIIIAVFLVNKKRRI
nr:hypothetical protein [Candidatus Sigynarchaeota archaeon]